MHVYIKKWYFITVVWNVDAVLFYWDENYPLKLYVCVIHQF